MTAVLDSLGIYVGDTDDDMGEDITQTVAEVIADAVRYDGPLWQLARRMQYVHGIEWAEACDRIARATETQAQELAHWHFASQPSQ